MASHIFPAPWALKATASVSKSNKNEGNSRGNEKGRELPKNLHGYMFLCNSSTKSDCYRYGVFGLPLCKKEIVEKIRPGTILFLFDFDAKLLHGIYEATTPGKVNLEPAAFSGKFPSQVKFKVVKQCSPIPESRFRQVIKENCRGTKHKLRLSKTQVKELTSLFYSLTASSSQPPLSRALPPRSPPVRQMSTMEVSSQPMPSRHPSMNRPPRPPPMRPRTIEARPWAMRPSSIENQFQHMRRLRQMDFDGMQYGRAASRVQPGLHCPNVNPLEQRGHPMTRPFVGRTNSFFYPHNPRFFP